MKGKVILSLQAYTFRDRSFVETLDTARRLGFEHVESYPGQRLGGGMEGTTDYGTMKPETLAQLKAVLDKSPVKMSSYGVTWASSDEQWTKLMEFCRALGVKQIQIEAGQDKSAYDRAEAFANRYGVRVSLHNHTAAKGMPKPMLESLQGRGPMIGAGADIGHWVRGGENALAGVKLLKGRFHEIHLTDVAPKECGFRDLPLGSGVSDIKAILDELADQGSDVYATVEYESATDTLEAEVAACARWFHAWERGEMAADDRLAGAASVGALWRGVAQAARPDTWELPANFNEGVELGAKTALMHRLELDLKTVKANKPGAVPHEDPPFAFGADAQRKFCQKGWEGKAWVSCGFVQPGTPKVYTVSSSNDAPGRDPVAWALLGSDDGVNWFTLDERKGQLFMKRFLLKGFEIPKPRACRFVKFEVRAQAGDSDVQFSRLGFFD